MAWYEIKCAHCKVANLVNNGDEQDVTYPDVDNFCCYSCKRVTEMDEDNDEWVVSVRLVSMEKGRAIGPTPMPACYLIVNGRYYRGARFWKWTRFKSHAAVLPEDAWLQFVIPKLRSKDGWTLASVDPSGYEPKAIVNRKGTSGVS